MRQRDGDDLTDACGSQPAGDMADRILDRRRAMRAHRKWLQRRIIAAEIDDLAHAGAAVDPLVDLR